MDWFFANWQFVLGSIIVPILIAIPWGRAFLKRRRQKKELNFATSINVPVGNTQSLESRKRQIAILFIDDDTKFQVVKILKSAGWVNTSTVRDIKSLDDQIVKDANILFVDVQGVGIALKFAEQGLGLAMALKKRYPEKKIIIYSAETKGDRFHQALREADSFLAKNAEPYEFQQLVEQFSTEL